MRRPNLRAAGSEIFYENFRFPSTGGIPYLEEGVPYPGWAWLCFGFQGFLELDLSLLVSVIGYAH
jgi:hypothetical protein